MKGQRRPRASERSTHLGKSGRGRAKPLSAVAGPGEPEHVPEPVGSAATRSWLYSILSLAFYTPNERAPEIWRGLTGLLAVSEGMPPSIRDAQEPSDGADLRQLEVEYNRLFVGPGHLPCPPYESAYTKDRPSDEVGLLAGPAVFDVKRLYAQAGFQLSSSFRDYPDHISVELEFMGHLCASESRSRGNQAERWADREFEFMNRHVGRWAGQFADSVIGVTTCPFYVAAATLLKRFALDEMGNLRPQEGR